MKNADVAALREELMALPVASRALLAQDLLASLDAADADPGVDTEWAKEAERRLEELESGKVEAFPGDAVLREVHARRS